MTNKGIHHLGLATHDMEATLRFYEGVLGFPARVCDLGRPEGGGTTRHAFLDMGNDELLAFIECNDVPGVPEDFDTGINLGLGINYGPSMIHFAFRVDDEPALDAKRSQLLDKGVEVTDVVDHGWSKSIYFTDPNRLLLEYCCLTGELSGDLLNDRKSAGWTALARS